jgi:hypothetical protein
MRDGCESLRKELEYERAEVVGSKKLKGIG